MSIAADIDAAYADMLAAGAAHLATVGTDQSAVIIEAPGSVMLAGRALNAVISMRFRIASFPALARSDVVVIESKSYRVDAINDLPGFNLERTADLSEL